MSHNRTFEEEKLLSLDSLRRSSGIRIDARGRWWHVDEPFEHPRVIKILNQGLQWVQTKPSGDEQPKEWSGEATVHVGEQWCYVDCDLTPFLVLKIKEDESLASLMVILNTGETLPLGPLELRQEILFSRLSAERYARFSVSAQRQVEPWLIEDLASSSGSGLSLAFADKRWPISIEPHE